jgi:hypothetical protein
VSGNGAAIGGRDRYLLLGIHRQRQTDDYEEKPTQDCRQPFFREAARFWMIPQSLNSSFPVSHPVPGDMQSAARNL